MTPVDSNCQRVFFFDRASTYGERSALGPLSAISAEIDRD